ncbi:hypothetical protein Tco_0650604 [Tanacetum coccineum]
MEKDSEIYKGKKERVKSVALKAKKESSDDETLTSKSNDKEYVMVVRNIRKFFRRKGRYVRKPREEKKSFQKRDDKKGKSDSKCFRCGVSNHLIGECLKRPRIRNKKPLSGVLGVIAKMRKRTKLTKKLVSWLNRHMRSPSSKGGLGFDKNEASTSGTKQLHFVKPAAVLAGNKSTIKIDDDLFTCDTPLVANFDEFRRLSRIRNDLFTCDGEVIKPSYMPSVEQSLNEGNIYQARVCYDECEKIYAEAVIFINKRLVRLIDVTVEQCYKKQFDEYMEIKRQLEVYGLCTDVECDPTNIDFTEWLASKFEEMIEEVLIDDELSSLEEKTMGEENKIAEIFRIETNMLHFETPLCKAFKEFNYLLQIDVHVLTRDLSGFKTYKEYKDASIYEWNKEVPWVEEKPWLKDGIWKEPIDELEDGDLKDEALKEKAILEGSWGHKNRKGLIFCSWLKQCFGNYHELDYKVITMLQEHWWGKKEEEESSDDAWSHYSPIDEWKDYEHTTYIETDVNSNQNTYNDVCQMFKDHAGMTNDDAI